MPDASMNHPSILFLYLEHTNEWRFPNMYNLSTAKQKITYSKLRRSFKISVNGENINDLSFILKGQAVRLR